jgi:magnesium chelatase subunit I
MLYGEEIDLWSSEYAPYHSKTPTEYVIEKILESEKAEVDVFPSVIGKYREKELVKNALLSGSPILLKGRKGYGKTTFSKAIAELLPKKILAVKGCKIYDDPRRPVCFSCKRKLLEENTVELTWVPRIWVRIPGDPMMTTRQLIGGISIQKIREGYDLDHPEVFIPGRALKANRGVGYFDELGALPSAMQTLLHELFEEHQVTTLEGDIVPFKVETLELASTNPANYRGTNPIKEPLLDRMEEIEIGPPETLEEEIEIGIRNMFYRKWKGEEPRIPRWHREIVARIVRYARDKEKFDFTKRIESEPSCRATIKLFDHLQSKALRSGRLVPLLSDYGENLEIVKLSLMGRIEVEFGLSERKEEIVERLFEEAKRQTCRQIYNSLPGDKFAEFYEALRAVGSEADGRKAIPIEFKTVQKLRSQPIINYYVEFVNGSKQPSDELYLSTIEIILEALATCTPRFVERRGKSYYLGELVSDEASMRSM